MPSGCLFREILYFSITCISGLEELTNANPSVSTVNDRRFPIKLTEIADWTSMSEYMLHSNFGQSAGILVHIPLYCRFYLFPKYLFTFWMFYQRKEYLNKIRILRNFREQAQVNFDKPTRVVLFDFSQQSSS